MPDIQAIYAERLRLSQAVVKTVQAVYAAKTPIEKTRARANERAAAKALDIYRKDHDC